MDSGSDSLYFENERKEKNKAPKKRKSSKKGSKCARSGKVERGEGEEDTNTF